MADSNITTILAELKELEAGTANLCFLASSLCHEGNEARANQVRRADAFIALQKRLIDALLAERGRLVPEGYVPAPKIATPSMVDAGMQELAWTDRVIRIWGLMIYAAESADLHKETPNA